jgi:hypothetical protein
VQRKAERRAPWAKGGKMVGKARARVFLNLVPTPVSTWRLRGTKAKESSGLSGWQGRAPACGDGDDGARDPKGPLALAGTFQHTCQIATLCSSPFLSIMTLGCCGRRHDTVDGFASFAMALGRCFFFSRPFSSLARGWTVAAGRWPLSAVSTETFVLAARYTFALPSSIAWGSSRSP